MTDTEFNAAPEAVAPVKVDLTPAEPQPEAPTPEPEGADYFATYDSLKAGETLQLLKLLNVEEADLAKTGTAQLLAVVWKHERSTMGASKMSELLNLTDKELLARLGLTEAEYVKQVTDYIESGSKS